MADNREETAMKRRIWDTKTKAMIVVEGQAGSRDLFGTSN
jgi:hypothetical protein